MPAINAPLARFHKRIFVNCCFRKLSHIFANMASQCFARLVIYSFTKFCKVLQGVKIIVFHKVLKWDLC